MATSDLPAERDATVETFLADWVSDQRIPGAAVAVVDDGDVVYAEGFGARDLESNAPATPETLFGVGSCTKAVTAAAVHHLAERDALELDDPVDDYLPHLADAPGDPVTVGELLTHTSGLPGDDMAGPLTARSLGLGHVEVPLSGEADFRRHVQGSVDRRVTDRETFFYYNSGYTMLGRVVEEVSGESFTDYVGAHVLAPLGMDRATFDREDFEAEPDRMTPYVKPEGSAEAVGFPFDPLIYPAGGLVCSVRELAGLVRVLQGDGTVDGETVLPPECVAAMTEPAGTFGTYLDGREVGYGAGLMVEPYLGDRLVGHGGSVAVSSAWFGTLADADLGVAIAATTEPETHPADAGMGVLALLQDEDPTEVQSHYRLVSALDSAAGEYAGYREIATATVERVGGTLRLELESEGGGGQELLLVPATAGEDALVCTTVTATGMRREVRFEFGGDAVDLFFERGRLEKSA